MLVNATEALYTELCNGECLPVRAGLLDRKYLYVLDLSAWIKYSCGPKLRASCMSTDVNSAFR